MWLSHLSPLVTIVVGAHCCVHIINDKTKDYCRRWNWVVPHLFGSCNSFAQLLRSYIVIDTCDIISSKLLRTIVKFHIMLLIQEQDKTVWQQDIKFNSPKKSDLLLSTSCFSDFAFSLSMKWKIIPPSTTYTAKAAIVTSKTIQLRIFLYYWCVKMYAWLLNISYC